MDVRLYTEEMTVMGVVKVLLPEVDRTNYFVVNAAPKAEEC